MTAIEGTAKRSSFENVACPTSVLRFCSTSERPVSSLMSAPAQNALSPAPVMSSARASLFATSSSARPRSAMSAKESALSAVGRLSVMSANSSRRVSSMAISIRASPADRLGFHGAGLRQLDQLALEYLAACGHRKRIERDEVFRHVVLREPGLVEVREQLHAFDEGAIARNHREAHALAEARIGHG